MCYNSEGADLAVTLRLCHMSAFDAYLRLVNFRRSLDSCKIGGFANKPVFLLGASLGGCISVCAIAQQVSQYQHDVHSALLQNADWSYCVTAQLVSRCHAASSHAVTGADIKDRHQSIHQV